MLLLVVACYLILDQLMQHKNKVLLEKAQIRDGNTNQFSVIYERILSVIFIIIRNIIKILLVTTVLTLKSIFNQLIASRVL